MLALAISSALKRLKIPNLLKMSAEAFAHIHHLSFDLQNPAQGSRAMHDLLCSNLKLTKRNLTKDLLGKLVGLGVNYTN